MDKEKILYHAKHNLVFTIQSKEYKGKMMENLDYLIKNKMLNWKTSGLWDEYSSCGQQDLYDDAHHEYKITPEGEVLLAIYRLAYAHKHHQGEDKHIRRIHEFYQLLEISGKASVYFAPFCTKNQKKAIDFAFLTMNIPVSDLAEAEPDGSFEVYNYDHIDLDEPALISMFNMSSGLGPKDSTAYRTENYVLRKTNEELGEMTLEMNIADGLSYKQAGSDGVKGEAVDLAICAMDMFALQCPGMAPDVIEREFLSYMLVKLNKWRDTLKK